MAEVGMRLGELIRTTPPAPPDLDKIVTALKATELSTHLVGTAEGISPKGAASAYQIIPSTFRSIKKLKEGANLPEIAFSELNKPENEPIAREYAKAIVQEMVNRGITNPRDIASTYNSGKLFRAGNKIKETREYVPRFLTNLKKVSGVPQVAKAEAVTEPGFITSALETVGGLFSPSAAFGAEAGTETVQAQMSDDLLNSLIDATPPEGTPTTGIFASASKTRETRIEAILDLLQERGTVTPETRTTFSPDKRAAILEMFEFGVDTPKASALDETNLGRLASRIRGAVFPVLFGPESDAAIKADPVVNEAFVLGGQIGAEGLGLGGKLQRAGFRMGPDIALLAGTRGLGLPGGATQLGALFAGTEALRPGSTAGDILKEGAIAAGTGATFGIAGKLGQLLAPSSRLAQVGSQTIAGGALPAAGGGDTQDILEGLILGTGFGAIGGRPRPGLRELTFKDRANELFGLDLAGTGLKSKAGGQALTQLAVNEARPELQTGLDPFFGRTKGQTAAENTAVAEAREARLPFAQNPLWMDFALVEPIPPFGPSAVSVRTERAPRVRIGKGDTVQPAPTGDTQAFRLFDEGPFGGQAGRTVVREIGPGATDRVVIPVEERVASVIQGRAPFNPRDPVLARAVSEGLDLHLQQQFEIIGSIMNGLRGGKHPRDVLGPGTILRKNANNVVNAAVRASDVSTGRRPGKGGKPTLEKAVQAVSADTAVAAGIAAEGRSVVPSAAMQEFGLIAPAGDYAFRQLSIADKLILLETNPGAIPEVLLGRMRTPDLVMSKDPRTQLIFDLIDRRIDPARRQIYTESMDRLNEQLTTPRLSGATVPESGLGVFSEIFGGRKVGQFRKLLPEEDLNLIGRTLDGQAAALEALKARPDLAPRVQAIRTLLNEIAEQAGLPKDRFISEYFPHFMRLNPEDSSGRGVPIGEVPVDIQAMVPKNRFFGPLDLARKELNPKNLDFNAHDVLRIYLYGASRWIAWNRGGGLQIREALTSLKRQATGNFPKRHPVSQGKAASERGGASLVKLADEFVINYLGRNKAIQNAWIDRFVANQAKKVQKLSESDNAILKSIADGILMPAFRSKLGQFATAPALGTRISNTAKALQFSAKIGANFVTPFVNMTQPLFFAAPRLSKVPGVGEFWLARSSLWWAMPEFRAIRKNMVDDGILSDVPKFDVDVEVMGRVSGSVVRALGLAFRGSEFNNRGLVYTAGFMKRMNDLKSNVKKGEFSQEEAVLQARRFARDLVNETQFRGGRVSLPLDAQTPLGGPLLQFKSFPLKSTELFARMSLAEQAHTVALLFAFAGSQAIPFLKSVDPDGEWWPGAFKAAGLNLTNQFGMDMFILPPLDMREFSQFVLGPTFGDAWILARDIGKLGSLGLNPNEVVEPEDLQKFGRDLLRLTPGGAQLRRFTNPEAEGLQKFFGTQVVEEP